MGSGRTVVFMRQNGWIVDDKTDLGNMEKLYGFTPSVEKKQEKTDEKCRVVSYPNFVYDKDEYRSLFESAGAHIYTEQGEVVCVGNGFIAVHAKGVDTARVKLACCEKTVVLGECGTAVLDLHTGERVY